MTHYCMLKNQPRRDAHMHELRITRLGPDEVREEWIGWKNGEPADTKVLDLKRKA